MTALRVAVVRGGGVAGVARETTLDAADLGDEDRDELRTLLDKAGVAAAPAPPPPAHADESSYEIRVEAGGEPVVARFRESSLPEGARALIAWVEARATH